MAKAITGFTITKPHMLSSLQKTKLDLKPCSGELWQCSSNGLLSGWLQHKRSNKKRASLSKVNAFPDWPLMAVMVEHIEGQRDLITHKSIWHLSDRAIKNVYVFYLMFTCWGCLFFGSMKDPYYDSEAYRKDGGDGSGHWVYDKQEDIEESARAELWREELIEEIEQKVGGLRELEEAGRKFSDLTGVDYSEGAIKLARRLADRDGFSNINLLVDDVLETKLGRQFQLVLDKGTLDAIGLHPDASIKRIMYWESVSKLVASGGILVITSCNNTKDELVQEVENFKQRRNDDIYQEPESMKNQEASRDSSFQYLDHVRTYPTFMFGGSEGSRVATVAFLRN